MRLLLALVVGLVIVLIVNGYSIREGNRALVAQCERHGGVMRASWDGGTLVSVRCYDERRFTR